MSKPLVIRASSKPKDIMVYGKRDQRGYDNKITVWLDGDDKLHINVLTPQLCYKYERTIVRTGSVEVIQV